MYTFQKVYQQALHEVLKSFDLWISLKVCRSKVKIACLPLSSRPFAVQQQPAINRFVLYLASCIIAHDDVIHAHA